MEKRIFCSVPAYGQMVTSATLSAMMALNRELVSRGIDGGFSTLSYPDVAEVRNIMTTIWYDKIKTSHMLFVDADMGFSPQLIMDMFNFDKPLVGALCPKKILPVQFAGRAKEGDVRVINGHMEVAGVGGALMLISREVITAMLAKFPEIDDRISPKNHAAAGILASNGCERLIRAFDHVVVKGEKFSEDLSFCIRWEQCGGEVWGNIAHEVAHVGLYEYRGTYYDQIKGNIRPEQTAPAAVVPEPAPFLEAAQ